MSKGFADKLRGLLGPGDVELARRTVDLEQRTAALEQRTAEFYTRFAEIERNVAMLGADSDRFAAAIEGLLLATMDEDAWLAQGRDRHRGQRCFLLGCGPSLNQVDLSRLEGQTVMGVNGTYLLEGVKLDYFVSVSQVFWKHHQEGLKQFRCTRRFLPRYLHTIDSDCPTSWINLIDRAQVARLDVPHPWMFSTRPHRYLFAGGTVIYVCLQLLYHMGFDQVVLLGLDHDYGIDQTQIGQGGVMVDSEKLQAHFTSNYYNSGGQVHIDIQAMERAYRLARQAYDQVGRRVVNASPGTRLEIFEQVAFDSLF